MIIGNVIPSYTEKSLTKYLFIYLVVIINRDSTDEEDIHIRIEHVTKLYYTLNNIFFLEKGMFRIHK